MVILIDTNVILDYITCRETFYVNAKTILEKCTKGELKGYIAAHSIPNIFFILRKEFSTEKRREILKNVCEILEVSGLSHKLVLSAIANDEFVDFEDCLQMECAKEVQAEYIITRNVSDYQYSEIRATTPEDFLHNITN